MIVKSVETNNGGIGKGLAIISVQSFGLILDTKFNAGLIGLKMDPQY